MEIPLRDKSGNIKAYTLVSPEDYEEVNKRRWCLNNKGYAQNRTGTLHRFIMKLHHKDIKNKIIDHINGDRLDNRYKNLRVVTTQINSHNKRKRENVTSKYYNVMYDKARKKYRASLKINKEKHDIGHTFTTEEEAAYARDHFIVSNYKEYENLGLKLNFPSNITEYKTKEYVTQICKQPETSSIYTGVSYCSKTNKWRAGVMKNNKKIWYSSSDSIS